MNPPALSLKTASIPLRNLPANSFLVHATNCIATWGAGIAAEMAEIFPAACKEYKNFCDATKPTRSTRWPPREALAGRCLIIPPQKADVDAGAPSVYIACLFTSYGYGKGNRGTGKPGRDSPGKILEQTENSLKEFREQLDAMEEVEDGEGAVVYSPKFNSGAFQVPWEQTAALVKSGFAGWKGEWVVLAPPA